MSKASSPGRKLKQRQCLICRDSGEKSLMLRLVVDDEGQIWPDILQKAPGRGTYLCMQQACLEGLTDRRLGALRNRFNVQLPQSLSLMQRIGEGLRRQLMRLFSQFGAVAVLGRDAVMHQMWKSGPLLVILASDAGDALVQQVEDGVGKRQGAGEKTTLLHGFSSSFLAEAFSRDKISVAALDTANVSTKLQMFCEWYVRVKESG
ncbi:MAG: DUF448 domain-containing protein [Mariprofundaceae bacterium]|nr:DUF448 domain-containing protein [Mariprofundaceae bacterium]